MNITEDGQSESFQWHGGPGTFICTGTFDGATVTLQFSVDKGAWIDVGEHTTLTAAGGGNFILPSGDLRFSTSGAGSTNIVATVKRVSGP